ncbi:phosphatase PAP2 family protein [uncultured Eudoraea sp.]|uniref:phosphatase PAP2 family protein n=1 Tax=uncultured Eudoraea sp. TaxID=1035614 RepID=UPI00262F49C0|nr:phosphatase PAP2 family protein [uncultured Eudoraea sp.]
MLEELMRLDKEVFLFLNNLGSSEWDAFWMFLTNKWSAIPLYVLLLILSYKQFGTKKLLVVLITVVLLITATDQLSNFFKYGIQRLRPCYDPEVSQMMRLVKDYCGGKFGYFSAHASNTSALALFFTILFRPYYKYLGIFLIVWAIFVSYSRIYIGVHFPLDVLSGIVVGFLFGWLFAKLYIFAIYKYRI